MSPPAPAPQPAERPALVLSIPREENNRLCLKYGPFVQCAGLLDPWGVKLSGSQLLLAMSGRESSFGRNLKPRFEPAYFTGGKYWRNSREVREGCALYGRDFASSFGSLQILACNARGFTPWQLGASPEAAIQAAVDFLNREVLGRQKATTLDAICDAWNTGNWRDGNVPLDYIAEVRTHYLQEVIA